MILMRSKWKEIRLRPSRGQALASRREGSERAELHRERTWRAALAHASSLPKRMSHGAPRVRLGPRGPRPRRPPRSGHAGPGARKRGTTVPPGGHRPLPGTFPVVTMGPGGTTSIGGQRPRRSSPSSAHRSGPPTSVSQPEMPAGPSRGSPCESPEASLAGGEGVPTGSATPPADQLAGQGTGEKRNRVERTRPLKPNYSVPFDLKHIFLIMCQKGLETQQFFFFFKANNPDQHGHPLADPGDRPACP